VTSALLASPCSRLDLSARTGDINETETGSDELAHDLPRRFHRIWFGPAPIPEAYERYWALWQHLYPDCTFTTWRDGDVASLTVTAHKIAQASTWAGKADIARLEIIYRHGGIYVDCDMMPLRRLDFWTMPSSLVVCHEVPAQELSPDDHACSTGFFAAPPGHPVLGRAIRTLATRPLNLKPPNIETGPVFFGEMIGSSPVHRLPTSVFYPWGYGEPRYVLLERDLQDSCAVHMWGASWHTPQERLHHARIADAACQDLAESNALIADLKDVDARRVRMKLGAIRVIRAGLEWLTRLLEWVRPQAGLARTARPLHWIVELLGQPGAQVHCIGAESKALFDAMGPALACVDVYPMVHKDAESCTQIEGGDTAALIATPQTLVLVGAGHATQARLRKWGRNDRVALIQITWPDATPVSLSPAEVRHALGKAYLVMIDERVLTAVRRDVARASATARYVIHGRRDAVSRRPGFTFLERLSWGVIAAAKHCARTGASVFRRVGHGQPRA
jgi:mannosyltransferase OCH1-like enzyme